MTLITKKTPILIDVNKLVIKPIKKDLANIIIEKYHYLHKKPANPLICFGVYYNNQIKGVAMFGQLPTMHFDKTLDKVRIHEILNLSRLWLSDELPKNSESRVIAICLLMLKKYQKKYKVVVSYADPKAGHSGKVYQATNFKYIGKQAPSPTYVINGERHHRRTFVDKYRNLKTMRKVFGDALQIEYEPGKHTYIYFLDKSYEKRLTAKILKYPKE